jgi:curved DNA-binding protein CbpA
MSDHYEALGVKKNASKDEIKKAYRRKAKDAHPDRKGGDNTEMVALNRAKDTLLDDEKRARYDAGGDERSRPPLDTMAEQAIAQAFDELLDQDNDLPDNINPIAAIERVFKQNASSAETQLKKIDLYMQRLERKAKRIKPKPGNELWASVLDSRRKKYQSIKLQLSERISVMKRACELLQEGYEGTATSTQPAPSDLQASFNVAAQQFMRESQAARDQQSMWDRVFGKGP